MSDFDGVSNVASAARFAMNPTPLGAAGLGLGIASSMLGGKGKKEHWKPKYRVNNGMYEMSDTMGKTWQSVPEGFESKPQDNMQLRVNELFGRNPNEVGIPSGQVINLATNQIYNRSVPSSAGPRSPYQWQTGDFGLPDGSVMNMATRQVVNNPNVNNTEPYRRQDAMIRGFADFMRRNPGSFANAKPQQLANALLSPPQYQAPNVQYQAPRG